MIGLTDSLMKIAITKYMTEKSQEEGKKSMCIYHLAVPATFQIFEQPDPHTTGNPLDRIYPHFYDHERHCRLCLHYNLQCKLDLGNG